MIARMGTGSWARSPGQTAESSCQILRELLKRRGRRARLDIHDHIHGEVVEAEIMTVRPVNLSNPSPKTVPDVRFSQLLRRRDPDARMPKRIIEGENDDEAGELFAAVLVGPEKVGALRNSFPLR